jgi:hypothetical protein
VARASRDIASRVRSGGAWEDGVVARIRLTDGTSTARLTLAVDLAALALFVVAGMRTHRTGSQLEIFLRNAVPIGGSWLVVSALLRTYRPVSLPRMVLTWLLALPAAVAIRTAWTGSADIEDVATFVGVAMAFTMLFLAAGRLASAVVSGRLAGRASRRRPTRSADPRAPAQ